MHLEDITSAVKKHNEDTPKINFYIFDLVAQDSPDDAWAVRYHRLVSYLAGHDYKRIDFISAIPVESHEEIKAIHDEYASDNYEGIVVRIPDEVYSFGQRTTGLIKYKERKDVEFKVIRIDADKHGCAIPWCEVVLESGEVKEFKAPLTGSKDSQRCVYANRDSYIGKWLKVEFESYSKYGKPLKPKGVAFRECDESGNPVE